MEPNRSSNEVLKERVEIGRSLIVCTVVIRASSQNLGEERFETRRFE